MSHCMFAIFLYTEYEKVIKVSYEEYRDYIKAEASIQVYLRGTVKETKRSYAHCETFSLTKPPLKLSVSWDISVYETFYY